LISLDGTTLNAWAARRDKIANYEALADDPDLRAEIDALVERVNAKRSRVEHVRKYRILAHELTIAAGEMTPTLKVKRAVVNETYADLIDAMYAEESAPAS
jgi:long-chain acyl-CoA synthetase